MDYQRPSDVILPAIDACMQWMAQGTSWTVLDGVGYRYGGQQLQVSRPADECKPIEFFQMMNACRRHVKAGEVCSDSATSTSRAAQAIGKNTWSGDFNEAHANVIESDVVTIDTRRCQRATGHKPVESIGE